MDTSKRRFLKLVSLATAGLAIIPSTPVIANNSIYVNKALGVAFRIPSDWYFYSVQQMHSMMEEQITNPESQMFDLFVEEIRSQPLVSVGMLPYDEEDDTREFSPSIVFMLEEKDEHDRFEDMPFYGKLFLERTVKDFRDLGYLPGSEICGYRSFQMKYGYLFESENMQPTPIIGRCCIVDAKSHYYSFNMYNYDPEDRQINAMFDRFVSSITILESGD